MDALIILDTTTTPNQIISCQERASKIVIVNNPSNCTMVVQYVAGQPDIIESVNLPSTVGDFINTTDLNKGYFHYDVNTLKSIWQSEGVDVSSIDTYIANNDLTSYVNPKRGYLIYDTELLKPFLIANGVDIARVIEFESNTNGAI